MHGHRNTSRFKKIAFILSILLLVLWGVLGTGASLAWFTDSTGELKNVFHFADFDLQVFHQLENGDWEEVDAETQLFDNEALYEPGYTEIIYMKVKNNGDVPFVWQTAVSVYKYTEGINIFGLSFNLQDYLRFGVVYNDSLTELKSSLGTRAFAVKAANEPLNNYYSDDFILEDGKECYFAIIVRMPEEVTSVANYKHPYQPEVFLNVIVSASQIKANK